MKRQVRAPLTMLLLCALAPLTLACCGGSTSGGDGLGTETGNPPVIKKEALHLEVAPGGVRLIGTPGAVTPGAEVNVTNRRTGASAATTAGADGSLDLTIAGETSDVYEVTVSINEQVATATLTAADLPADLSTLSCQALGNALSPVIAATYADADHSCAADEDCTVRYWGEGCYNRCGSEILAASAVEATSALAAQRIAGLCSEIEGRSCELPAPTCAPSPLSVVRCEEGQCVGRELGELSCDDVYGEASSRRLQALRSADRSCGEDTDCTVATHRLRCVLDCGVAEPVASAVTSSLDQTVLAIEEQFCGAAEQRGCPPMIPPPCNASPFRQPVAQCVQGQCEVRFEPQD